MTRPPSCQRHLLQFDRGSQGQLREATHELAIVVPRAMSKVVVTGAFSYTGRYLTHLLLERGHTVVNLTNHPGRAHGFSPAQLSRIATHPLDFSRPDELARALEGADQLVCTYWIRFAGVGGDSHDAAAARLAGLWELARAAGVRKVLFTSHTRATESSPYAYIAGKARAAAALRASGVESYAIARPCGVFGDTAGESILMNNAAWVLRRTPLFLLAGDGDHRFQPVHVRDFAQLLLELGASDARAEERDACGPDAPRSRELFGAIARAVGSRALVAAPGLSTRAVTTLTRPLDWVTGDTLLDEDDLDLLCSGLTVADDPDDPAIAARRSLLAWLAEVGPSLGQEYANSMVRYYKK